MIIGKNFRTLLEKQRDNQPSIAATAPSISIRHGATRLESFIRTFWVTAGQDRDALERLRMGNDRYKDVFGHLDFTSNVDTIISGLVPEARNLFQNGVFRVQDLLSLPDANTFPRAGQFIYIWVYLHLDGTDQIGLYVGQTKSILERIHRHRYEIAATTPSPHYNVARRAQEHNRHVFVLCFWDEEDPQSHVAVDMAEQTMILAFGSYNGWMTSPHADFHRLDVLVSHDRCSYLRSIARQTQNSTGWQRNMDVETIGCNISSPLFTFLTPAAIECFRTTALSAKPRGYTSYRKRVAFIDMHIKTHKRVSFAFRDGDKSSFNHHISFDVRCFERSAPESGFLVFEIMDDGQPHDNPYFGCPSVGPFKNFDQVSALGIRIEWLDETTNEWLTVPLSPRPTKTGSLADSLWAWKRALTFIQVLQGVTWSGPLNGPLDGLLRSPNFGSRRVLKLVIDHLQQTCQWVPQQGKVLPAPALATWGENFLLMADQFGHGATVICRQQPPLGDDFWLHHVTKQHPRFIRCDFCKYSTRRNELMGCERDTRRTHVWVCNW